MNELRVLIADDDMGMRTVMRKIVERVEDFILVAEAADGKTALELTEKLKPDVVFLDVEMPGTSGITVGAALKQRNPRIKIFIVTAYPDYLDEAMRFQVFRYLSKPIDKNRLHRNLKDAVFQYNMESYEFPISTNDGVFTRRSEEIICVETSQRKTIIHTTDGTFVSVQNIEYWKQTLTLPCFYPTHRSFIVNMQFVYSIGKDTVILKNGNNRIECFLSRRKYSQFKDAYLMYMESIR